VATSAGSAGVILIADGEASARNLRAEVFERAGFRTAHASTGHEALEPVGAAAPAAAILEPSLECAQAVIRSFSRERS
jgi:CheY-like chemotaxis protein